MSAGGGRANPAVDHPAHYGGAGDPYEAIKVIEAWGLGFCLGNTVKYIVRCERKGAAIEDLAKARWYLDREIARRRSTSSPPETPGSVVVVPSGAHFRHGQRVRKSGGDYTLDGTVVGIVAKRSGAVRYVVEDERGILMIYSDAVLSAVDGGGA